MALCGDCAVPCDVCYIPIGRKQAQITSTGRSLCPKCMAERNAKRRLRREKMKTASRVRKRAERGEAIPGDPEPPVRPVVRARSLETPKESQGRTAAPAAGEAAKDGIGPDSGADFGAGPDAAKDDARKRDFGLEGVPMARSSRLELPPLDETRPIMVMSGHRAPTKTAYFFAFAFFGIAGLVFYSTTPILRDIMFPFDTHTPEYKFSPNQLPVIMDTNRLRNTSNVSQLQIFSQVPAFFLTWAILIAYVGGSVLIIVSTARSAISSFRSKRQLRKAQKKHQGDPFSSLPGQSLRKRSGP